MNILVLAGGADQIALIQELRSRNVQNIVLIDYYEILQLKNMRINMLWQVHLMWKL